MEDYAYTVLDKRSYDIQDWDYIDAQSVLNAMGRDARRKRLKRAIAQARRWCARATQRT